jgi:hypothetical protein
MQNFAVTRQHHWLCEEAGLQELWMHLNISLNTL